jgi:hypothetical protein
MSYEILVGFFGCCYCFFFFFETQSCCVAQVCFNLRSFSTSLDFRHSFCHHTWLSMKSFVSGIMLWGCICAVASFLFITENYSIVWIYGNLFIHVAVGGYFVYFQFWAIMNKHTSLCVNKNNFISFG